MVIWPRAYPTSLEEVEVQHLHVVMGSKASKGWPQPQLTSEQHATALSRRQIATQT
ncbi:hypothetical protein ACSBR2_017022 [Camellia fascicularis]